MVTNSSIFAVGRVPGSASSKVRFFKHLRFLFQPNEKLTFAKYHSRGGLRNTTNTQFRVLFRNSSPKKLLTLKTLNGVLDPLVLKYIRFYDFVFITVENRLYRLPLN